MSNPVVPDPIGIKGKDGETLASVANRVPVELGANPTIDIGVVDQGEPGSEPWLVEPTPASTSTPDSGNSKFYTSADGVTPFVGAAYDTRSTEDLTKRIIAAQQVVFASNVAAGLGLTYTFEYGPDGLTWPISEVRTVESFQTVRDLTLQNAGNFFRISFTPSRALTGGEFINLDTTQWFIAPPPFVRLADQQIEKGSAAMSQAFAYIKGFGLDGTSADVPLGGRDPDNSTVTPLGASGTFTGAYRKTTGFSSALVFILSDVELTTARLRWSEDGVSTRPGLLGTSALAHTLISGFHIYLSTLTTMIDQYVRLEIVNGVTPTGLFEADTWMYDDPFPGSFSALDATLSTLSTALLTRAVVAGLDPDGVFKNSSLQGRHTGNSSVIPLPGNTGGSDHIFRGTWFSWQQSHIALVVDVASDVDGSLFIDFSQAVAPVDGDDSSITESSDAISYSPTGTPLLRRTFPVQSKWVRVRYINGTTAQSTFGLDTAFTVVPVESGLKAAAAPTLKRNLVEMSDAITTSLAEESVAGSEVYTQDRATLNPTTLKRGKNATITKIEAPIGIRPMTSGNTSQVTCGTSAATRLDPFPLADRKSVMFSNMEKDIVVAGEVEYGNEAVWGHDPLLTDADGFDLPVQLPIALLLHPDVPLYVRAKSTGTPTTNTQVLSGTTSSGTATNPANAKALDSVYSNITAAGQDIHIGGYSIAPTLPTLQSVILRAVGKKQAGQFQTGAFQEAQIGNSTGIGSVVSASIAGGTAQTYLAAIAREVSSATNGTVSGVTGLGLTWTQVATQNSDDDHRRLDIWTASGVATAGAVTATFSTVPTSARIAVHRLTGLGAVQASGGTAANSGTVTGPALSGTDKGISFLAAAINNATSTAGAGYTERSDDGGTTGTSNNLTTETKALTATGSETGTFTLSGAKHYACIGVTVLPAAASDPQITLSYKLSGVAGATSGAAIFTSTSNQTLDLDVTADRAWTFDDVPNIEIIGTGLTLDAASADPDALQLVIVETSGNVCRICLHQGAHTDE